MTIPTTVVTEETVRYKLPLPIFPLSAVRQRVLPTNLSHLTQVEADPATTTTTVTTTCPPQPTCTYPANDQMQLRGSIRRCTGAFYQGGSVRDAQRCYTIVKGLRDQFSGMPYNLQSYVFVSDMDPGSSTGPGTCYGYTARSCEVFAADPAGPGFGGDTSLPF